MEKLTEETLRDRSHLKSLLCICEGKKFCKMYCLLSAELMITYLYVLYYFSAQRQIGETSLNETSSRSHQILRLVCLSVLSLVCVCVLFSIKQDSN